MPVYIKKNVISQIKDNSIIRKIIKPDKRIEFTKLKFDAFEGSSRIPFGGDVLGDYVINPFPKKFEKYLSEELNSIINDAPECIDGQNGNILDNIIDNWASIAKCNIEEQKCMREMAFNVVCESRTANLQQAKEYLSVELDALIEIEKILSDLQK